MAPRSLPRSQAAHAKIAESIRRSDGSYDLQKFKQLRGPEKLAVLEKCWDGIHDYFKTGHLTESSYHDLNFMTSAMNEMGYDVGPLRQFLNPIHGYSGSTKLLQGLDKFKQKVSDPDLLASIAEWENAVRKDPLFYTSKGTHHGRPLEEYQKNGIDIDSVDPKQYDALGTRIDLTPKDTPVNPETPVEPSVGVLTDKPLNDASPAETPSGALTKPPAKLPEVGKQPAPSRVQVRDDEGNIIEFEVGPKKLSYQSWDDAELNEILAKGSKKRETNEKLPEASNQPELPNVGKTIKEAEANAYTGNEPPIAGYNTPITPPGVHVSFNEKPVNLSPEEIAKFKPNPASPSPEAIGKAMRDAVKEDTSKDSTVTVPPEAEAAAKMEAEAKTKAATDKTEPKAPETAETPQGLFSRLGGYIGRNWGKYLLGGGLGTVGWGIIRDLASDNSRLKSSFTEGDYTLDANQPRVKSLDQREGAYMPERLLRFTTNEEYTPGRIPSHIPQDNLPSIKESTASKKVKSQPQVVNAPAPENNATADYVRAAYNSYIPSDAGRAYQKAIYGDPLELERNRQQQKWRDFVMRSGQSPAELVQRGLMPYDALQYV